MLKNSFIVVAFPIFDKTYSLFISPLFLGSAALSSIRRAEKRGISLEQSMMYRSSIATRYYVLLIHNSPSFFR